MKLRQRVFCLSYLRACNTTKNCWLISGDLARPLSGCDAPQVSALKPFSIGLEEEDLASDGLNLSDAAPSLA